MASNDLSMPPIAVDTNALLDRGQRYCATAEHCPADVEQLFLRLGATREQTDEVIGILLQQDYLNPARYCRAFVHDKVAFQSWGRAKVLMGLRAKHLPEADIRDALCGIDETVYATNIHKLLRAKRGLDKPKIIRFMLQRGYTFDDLSRYADYETDD